MDTVKIGKFLSEMRRKHGLTQREFAELLGISDKTVSKWETGFQTPIFSTLQCLAELFGVSIDSLGGKTQEKDNVEAAKVALFSGAGEVTDEMWQEVVNFAKYVEAREAQKNENK